MTVLPDLDAVRKNLGRSLFGLVAGPDGPTNRSRIHDAPGPRWFDEDRPIRQVHADASMFVGGLRALLLQSLHPLAMAGVAEHSDYRGDPWGRLQRTSTFLAVTTFGPATDAQRAVDKVRGIHRRVNGVAPDGRPYAASDPHLLEWVHIAEVDSFLLAHQLYGAHPLDQSARDGYVADTARIAAALGVVDPPQTERELAERIEAFRPGVDEHTVRPAGGTVPAADSSAAGRRARSLRSAGGDLGGDVAGMGTNAAAAAVLSASGGHGGAPVRPCSRRRNPVGVGGYPLTQSRHSTMSYTPSA